MTPLPAASGVSLERGKKVPYFFTCSPAAETYTTIREATRLGLHDKTIVRGWAAVCRTD